MIARLTFGMIAVSLILAAPPVRAQFEVVGENGTMEFTGRLRIMAVEREEFDGDDDQDHDRIFVQQARIGIQGDYLDDFEYELEFELRGYIEDGSPMEAKDLFLAYSPRTEIKLYAGQFRTPFGRMRTIPRSKLITTRRPGVGGDFLPGRDVGGMIRLRSFDKKYMFRGGIFTGAGPNRSDDDRLGKKLLVGRVEIMPLGMVRKSEGDSEYTRELRVHMGAGFASSEDAEFADDDPEYLRTIPGRKDIYGFDFTLKCKGLFLNYEENHASFEPDPGRDFDAGGYLVQASYYWDRGRLEPRIMYDEFNPSSNTANDTEKTVTYGLNFYPHGRLLNLMLEYADHHKLNSPDTRGWDENEIRFLLQVSIE